MRYCTICGKPMEDDARFCSGCGRSAVSPGPGASGILNFVFKEVKETVLNNLHAAEASYRSMGQEQQGPSYQTELMNCPFCGAPVSSFVSFCQSCGRELNRPGQASACMELAERLERIDANRQRETIFTTVNDVINKARKRVVLPIADQEKMEVISSFVVPNNKADLLEFILLAQSRMETAESILRSSQDQKERTIQQQYLTVWQTKLAATIQKADLSLRQDPDYGQIRQEYFARIYRRQGRCAYCGGKFRGLIRKTCEACGKERDYDPAQTVY